MASPSGITPEAESRAEELLLSYLSPHQTMTYQNHGFFYVKAKDGLIYAVVAVNTHVYRVHNRTGRPQVLHSMRTEISDRWGRPNPTPKADKVLAALLWLESWGTPCYCSQVCQYSGNHALNAGHHFEAFKNERWQRALRLAPAGPPHDPFADDENRWPPVDGLFGG